MMIKIIFFDIDGTLVSFKTHTIPQSTIDAIHNIRQKGIKVWIATGRPLPFINNLGELEYDGIISVTGAHCQTKEGITIFSSPVDHDDIQRMIDYQHNTGIAVAYAGNKTAIMTAPHGITDEVREIFSLLDIKIPEIHDPEDALTFEVMEVIAFFKEDESKEIMTNILQGCNENRWHPLFTDCVKKGTDKAIGIDKVIEYYGYDISEVMAFGDGGNDISMLRHAGIGIAMGNANDDVKAAADIVTTSVDDNGVANILYGMIEQETPVVTKMIDLHLHLDGAISLNSARELATLQDISIPENDNALEQMMRVSPDCRNLNDFLEKFSFPLSLLQTPEGISLAVHNLCEELKAQNVIYAEIRFAPQRSCDKGMTQDQVVEAAIAGLKRSTLRANLILCCMRGDITPENEALNRETIRLAAKYIGKGVCGVDLAGAEALFPTKDFGNIFSYARELNLPFEIHAGEADGPESVHHALDFGANRIGHGVRSIEDPSLVKELSTKQIPLLICPTSNLQTCIVPKIDDLPIRMFLNAGIPIVISSDDPSIEGTNIRNEWEKVITAFRLTKEEVRRMMLNAVNACFCSADLKQELKKEIEQEYYII